MNRVFLIAAAASVLAIGVIYIAIQRDSKQEVEVQATSAAVGETLASSSVSPITTPAPISTPKLGNTSKKEPVSADAEERYQTVSDNPRLASFKERLAELDQLYPYREFAPAEVLDLLAQRNAWQSSSDTSEGPPITDKQRADGRAFIEVNPERFMVLLPGDNIELPLEKLGMNLQVQIDSREPLPNGGFTLHGRVLGSDELMRVTITQGPGLSLAGIDTPQGHVVMQANDSHGWIASSETLFKQNPHKTDVLLPTDE